MTLRIQQLIDLWGEPEGAVVDTDQPVGRVCTDSRRLGAGDFFVPLVGERFDGHRFLSTAVERGAQAAFVASDCVAHPGGGKRGGGRRRGGEAETGRAAARGAAISPTFGMTSAETSPSPIRLPASRRALSMRASNA